MLDIREEGQTRSKNTIAPEMGADDRGDVPMQIFGKKYPKYWWTSHLVQFPTVYCAVFTFIPLILCILSISVDVSVDRGTSSFSIYDHSTAQKVRAVEGAQEAWREQYDNSLISAASTSGSTSSKAEPKYRLYVNYEANKAKINALTSQADYPSDGDTVDELLNLFHPDALAYMHTFEKGIATLTQFKDLCWNSPFRAGNFETAEAQTTCSPLTSLMTYFYIGYFQNTSDGSYWEFDGVSGEQQVPQEKVLDRIWTNPRHLWFMDQGASSTNRETKLMRTQITLGWPKTDAKGDPISEARYDERADSLIVNLIDYFSNPPDSSYIDITFGGDRIQEALILQALRGDAGLVALGLLVVFIVLWRHFHSVILSMIAILQILLTYPSSFYVYVRISGEDKTSLLTVLTFFFTLVMTLDGIMITFDTFKHSGFMPTTGRVNTLSVEQRMAYVYRKSGLGVGVSSIIALICFAINTSSPVPAVSGFAGLMVVLTIINAYMMLLVFPTGMLFHHFHISKRRRNLQRQKEVLVDRTERHRYTPQQVFHREVDEIMATAEQPTYEIVLRYMEGERDNEQAERDTRAGILGFLGVQNPVRFPNPFPMKVAVEPAFSSADQEAEEQGFVDQFPDAIPDGKGGVVLKGEAAAAPPSRRCLGTSEVVQISNYNIDEMLGFDDTVLRHKLHETGHSAADEFSQEELLSMCSEFGITSLGSKADERLKTIARTAIYLIFGIARTLNGACYEDANQGEHGGKRRKKKRAPTAAGEAADQGETAEPEQKQDGDDQPRKKHRFKVTKKVSEWWSDRKAVERKWCCGMVGQRINETQQEKEERIMKKKIKHEGFTAMERFFFNKWAPMLAAMRWPIAILLIALFVASAVLASLLEPASTPPQFLGDNPSDDYDAVAAQFAEEGSCDYCSAYFRPPTDFPSPTSNALLVCAAKYNIQLMHAEADLCDVCFGTNECLDCAGTPSGTNTYDQCGQCRLESDPQRNSCLECSVRGLYDMACASCVQLGITPVGFAGSNCTQFCDPSVNCLPSHGTCNKFTGICDCHQDAANGYWMDDPSLFDTNQLESQPGQYCTVCLSGWVQDAFCKTECSFTLDSTAPCSCAPFSNTCTGCAIGLFGSTCSTRNQSFCSSEHGTLSATDHCICDSGWDDGANCMYSELCAGKGILRNASEVYGSGEVCVCAGQWTGPACTYCACFNGGICDTEGKCVCLGDWIGNNCGQCNSTCLNSVSGECPLPLSYADYDTDTCRGLFCTEDELKTQNASTASCLQCNPPSSACDPLNSPSCAAVSSSGCSWDTWSGAAGGCRLKRTGILSDLSALSAEYTTCRCKGSFTGIDCTTCDSPHPDVTCTEEGILVGCDGLPADSSGVFKVVDFCGNCGGSSECYGCDGIPGSLKVVDSCGVCGGDDDCQSATETTASIIVAYGLNYEDASVNPEFDLTTNDTQDHLVFACEQLNLRSDIIKPSQSTCIWLDFVAWMKTAEAWTAVGYTMTFPFPDNRVHSAFYYYARINGRLTEAGFSGTDTALASFKCTWIQLHLRAAGVPQYGDIQQLNTHFEFWRDIVVDRLTELAAEKNVPPPFMASSTWVSLFTQLVAERGTVFSISFGILIFLALMLPLTCSPRLTLLCGIVLVNCVLMVMGIFFVAGWTLGPVEQVVLTLLLGTCTGQIVQTAEGYLEYVHSAQSHLFARETTQLQAVKGMFQRTGVSVFTSGCTLIVCSSLLFFADLLIFRRVAAIVIIITLTVMFHTMVIMGGCLCIVGPTESFRKPRVMFLFGLLGISTALFAMLILGLTGAVSAREWD